MKSAKKVELFEKFDIELETAKTRIRNGEILPVHFSAGNTKTHIPSVDLLPVFTCHGRCRETCGKVKEGRKVPDCYACKGKNTMPTTIKNRAENTAMAILKPDIYWAEVDKISKASRFIRYFVSGDMIIKDYFEHMVINAKNNPHCNFLCFTKCYEIVNRWIDKNGDLPENMQVILSGWFGMRPNNPYNLPETAVYLKEEDFNDNWLFCGGNCLDCACRGLGCWKAGKGDIVAFKKH